MKYSIPAMMICAPFLAAASCTKVGGVKPCDVLTPIPAAPKHVNKLLVKDAKPTAQAIAIHQKKVKHYRCI